MRRIVVGLLAVVMPTAACGGDWHPAPLFPAMTWHHSAAVQEPGEPCLPPPPAVRDMETVSKYGNHNKTNSTVVDPDSDAQYKADTQPIVDYGNEIVRRSDRFIEDRDTGVDDARCALDWLDGWAQGDALLGTLNGPGQSVRKWELATFATTYMKIADAPLDAERKERVRKWIHDLAEAAQTDFSSHTELKSRQNNHIYWAAWGVAAAGIATGDRAMFDWGMDRYRFALSQIGDDGSLPLELARRDRAAGYHMFALQPLIMLAEAGEANGIDTYAMENNRLQKLIDLNLAALKDPQVIERINGYKQLDLYSTASLSWMEPYYARFHDPRVLEWLDKDRPMKSRRTGGNMTALYLPSARKAD